ncbi:MAG TPA: GNAT family N-acetyltransferase [Solirubrobacterales bacterium]|nr:GNAT family N-acetyltransferase [Solirubrobacterales bacterium]
MEIRRARDEESPRIAALWTEAYTARHPEGRKTPYAESDYFEAAREGEVWVAEEGGEALGVVVFYPPAAAGRVVGGAGEAELSRLAVAGEARRRGVGRALVELVGERARQEGAAAVVLWSRPYQLEAQRIYEAVGYERVPQRDSRDADGGRRIFVLCLSEGAESSG